MRTPIVSWRSDPPVFVGGCSGGSAKNYDQSLCRMHGLRDRGLLESAVARAENLAYYSPEATVSQIAAALAWGLLKNHALVNGNKRIGSIALFTFLDLNGCKLTCSEAEETAMVLRAATSEIDEAAWTARVERSVGPL